MGAYIDTSALAKCYIREPHSLAVLDWVETHGGASVCSLSQLEFCCLLARRVRTGTISAELEATARSKWEADLRDGFWHLELIEHADFTTARQLMDRVKSLPLRALDALHLAAAHNAACRNFLTADRTQAAAAEQLGFTVHTFFDTKAP